MIRINSVNASFIYLEVRSGIYIPADRSTLFIVIACLHGRGVIVLIITIAVTNNPLER